MSRRRSTERPVNVYYGNGYQSIGEFKRSRRLQGPFRVIVFCLLAIFLPCLLLALPLYIRYEFYKDVTYNLGESDLVTVDQPISTFWCEGQELRMNATFHAYLLSEKPQISEDLKQIEMKKHMQLADDTLEYWGFFLLQGAVMGDPKSLVNGQPWMYGLGLIQRELVGGEIRALKERIQSSPVHSPHFDFLQSPNRVLKRASTVGHLYEIFTMLAWFDGARLMVVKGAKNLKHCALIESAKDNDKIDPWEEDVSAPQGEKIQVTFQQGEVQTPPKNIKANSKSSALNATVTTSDILYPAPKTNGSLPPTGVEVIGNSSRRNRGGKRKDVGRKPSTLPPAPEFLLDPAAPELTRLDSDVQIETLHDNVKVLRHTTRLGGRINRTKRFLMTEVLDGTYEDGDYKEEDPGHAHEPEGEPGVVEDLAPNPVGIEPALMEVEKDAETHLSEPEEVEGEMEEAIDEEDIRSSGSSFAKNLWSCYGGETLFTQTFSASPRCQSQDAMMKYARMKMVHEVTSTGYYYYIFYSDNDIISNAIFATFNIEKVEYSFPNYTNSCLNSTQCSLPLAFFSSEKVLLEVPLQDGVSDEDALAQNQIVLISTCKPRLSVYLFFPIAILFVIIACAFI